MTFSPRRQLALRVLTLLGLGVCALLGLGLGAALASIQNIQNLETFGDYQPALPSQILDANGELITQFFSDEKREIVSLSEMPKHLLDALITREDGDFFQHSGFSIRGTLRALWQILTGRLFSGGSTLSQQLAGHLYANRRDITIWRKIVELWWAWQIERKFSKYEILEQYLNKMPFGHNTYGVEAASQFYFRKSVRDITVSESVLLVIQLVSPGLYSPIRNPNGARTIQTEILNQMVANQLITQETAEYSLDAYWNNYDWQREDKETAFFNREDRAPYFSEYIRAQLDENLLGALDIYRDGFVVHTTLDLRYQAVADQAMARGLEQANQRYRSNKDTRLDVVDQELVPLVDLLSLAFNVEDIRVAGSKAQREARQVLLTQINPVLDLATSLFGINELKEVTRLNLRAERSRQRQTVVEGALITLENNTGFIRAMVGGSQFERTNQFNRAVQARVQPGSTFKPLYYSAAIDSRRFTAASRIYDGPVVFYTDGRPYTPLNFRGEWRGNVLLRDALAQSMNVPAIQVLDAIGFDAAIERSAKLLGITDPETIRRTFPRAYPLGLGVISVNPMQMARAFATFANQGRAVEPIAIRYIEDRNGNVIANPAADLLNDQRRRGGSMQILSPQGAYIMTSLLKSSVETGTLRSSAASVGGFGSMDMAGKTGTTQNWSDAWSVGYSPYMTTAVWFGFDTPGNSLGLANTGATTAGPVWAQFMKQSHSTLQPRTFTRPSSGLVEVTVDARTGLLPSGAAGERTIREIFLEGTAPTTTSTLAEFEQQRDERVRSSLERNLPFDTMNLGTLDLNLDLNLRLDSRPSASDPNSRLQSQTRPADPLPAPAPGGLLDYNPLLD